MAHFTVGNSHNRSEVLYSYLIESKYFLKALNSFFVGIDRSTAHPETGQILQRFSVLYHSQSPFYIMQGLLVPKAGVRLDNSGNIKFSKPSRTGPLIIILLGLVGRRRYHSRHRIGSTLCLINFVPRNIPAESSASSLRPALFGIHD